MGLDNESYRQLNSFLFKSVLSLLNPVFYHCEQQLQVTLTMVLKVPLHIIEVPAIDAEGDDGSFVLTDY